MIFRGGRASRRIIFLRIQTCLGVLLSGRVGWWLRGDDIVKGHCHATPETRAGGMRAGEAKRAGPRGSASARFEEPFEFAQPGGMA